MLRLVPEVLDRLERHHGTISAAQLRDAGYSATAIKKLVRAGVLELVLSGAYRQRGRPLTLLGRCAAVCLAHPNLVVAGPTAAAIWEFRRVAPEPRIVVDGQLVDRVHVIAPPKAQPTVQRWVRVYRTDAIHLDADVIERHDGIRVTDRRRTAFDLARTLGGVELLSVIEQAMRDGDHDLASMRAVAVDWCSTRRRWAGDYLAALDRTLPGSPAESHPEVRLGEALDRAGVAGLERQFQLTLPGYGDARFDLAVPASHWAIEVDVFPTHAETAGRRADEARDRAAHHLGWTVTRLRPEDLGEALPATVDRLVALAARLRPSVAPDR